MATLAPLFIFQSERESVGASLLMPRVALAPLFIFRSERDSVEVCFVLRLIIYSIHFSAFTYFGRGQCEWLVTHSFFPY